MDAIKYRQALILVPAFCIGGYNGRKTNKLKRSYKYSREYAL